ncbi:MULTISPECIES: sigma-70 family RNA polymerase sigma factor [Frankia]|uniref:ECF-subfamily RNA polymerase sigma factor n=1 Tax=Frankia alni (strain DSM 45986 / CECT 9034 / ACN14a) TaxID=326424 RepID=Q0RJN7_FRAAA|nr:MULTISPECIES: sigma-70 family RNA polymerase sigma factor [Frankia]CAJ62275.1 putative ECF-subfamily RNA polymerase sigma factor [Frankia alni ACN14a]
MGTKDGRARALHAVRGGQDVPRGVPPAPTLEALLIGVARGDRDGFAALYDRLAPLVFGLARRVLRDPAQAEEVAQEVFVAVWRDACRFDPDRGSVTGWVSTMTHRRAVDRVRSVEAEKAREHRAAGMYAARAHDQVAEQVELHLEHERVRGCLDSLTPRQRESITLAYYSGFTYREVAELLTVPVGTVKTRMRDGLSRLSDCLGMDS